MMSDVKEGLEILLKYGDACMAAEHDIIRASNVKHEKISAEDKFRLEALGWFWSSEFECWAKFV